MGKNEKLQSVVSPLASYIYPYISSGFVDHTRSQLHFQPRYLMYMCRYNELGQGWEHGGAWIDVNKEDTWKSLLQSNSGPLLGLLFQIVFWVPVCSMTILSRQYFFTVLDSQHEANMPHPWMRVWLKQETMPWQIRMDWP